MGGEQWKIVDFVQSQGNSPSVKFQKGTGPIEAMPEGVISGNMKAAGFPARMSGYNQMDYDSDYDGDYGDYDAQALFDEAYENLQSAREQFEIAQRLLKRGQRQSAQRMRGQSAQRLRRYGGY